MNDAQLIESLGGPAQVARMLSYDIGAGGTQRVHNWLKRGIPARVKLDHPDVFLRSLRGTQSGEGPAAAPKDGQQVDAVAVLPKRSGSEA